MFHNLAIILFVKYENIWHISKKISFQIAVVYVVPIYVMVHLSYNSYRVMNHRKRASMFSQKVNLELDVQTKVAYHPKQPITVIPEAL